MDIFYGCTWTHRDVLVSTHILCHTKQSRFQNLGCAPECTVQTCVKLWLRQATEERTRDKSTEWMTPKHGEDTQESCMNDLSTNCQCGRDTYEIFLPNGNYTHIWPMADHVSESSIILHLSIEIKVSTISNFKNCNHNLIRWLVCGLRTARRQFAYADWISSRLLIWLSWRRWGNNHTKIQLFSRISSNGLKVVSSVQLSDSWLIIQLCV